MDWDDTLTRLSKVVSVKTQTEEYYVRDAVEHFIKATKEALRRPDIPAVQWPRFGTFRASHYKIEKRLKRKIRKYKEGIIKRTTLFSEVEKYNQPRRRLREELFRRQPTKRKAWEKRQASTNGDCAKNTGTESEAT